MTAVSDFCALDMPSALERTENLTPREREALLLLGAGYGNEQIARRMRVTVRTARAHLEHVQLKLAVGSRANAIVVGWALHAATCHKCQ
ncbi:hypothetical protein GCM10009839_21660 [Catenulispora yoronensis]|uniref:HTH luxR-type domain-containing protein n=1 Tax=Catenulispora yoronensis TaxID=450799 RepID=A0ABN2TXW5_9ACTN